MPLPHKHRYSQDALAQRGSTRCSIRQPIYIYPKRRDSGKYAFLQFNTAAVESIMGIPIVKLKIHVYTIIFRAYYENTALMH